MPTISVIVPIYNTEQYLIRCIKSVLTQTFSDFELILINDGSTDNCRNICFEYSLIDNRIVFINQENKGQAAARNKGVQIAKGDFCFFLDSDDTIHPQTLEILYNGISKYDANISICNIHETDVIPEIHPIITNVQFSLLNFDENFCIDTIDNKPHIYWITCARLIKASIVKENPYYEGKIFEDNAISCIWLKHAQKIVEVNHVLYYYYINPNGTTKSNFNEKHFDYLWALIEQLKLFKSLEFKRMLFKVSSEFYNFAVNYYYVAQKSFPHKTEEIKKQIKIVNRTYSKYKNHNLHTDIRNILYPKTNKLLDVLKYIKHNGPKHAFQKIINKLFKKDKNDN